MKALVALSSRLFDSAAADGCRIPPARETGTGVVGFSEAGATIGAAVTEGSDGESSEEGSAGATGDAVAAGGLPVTSTNRVTILVLVTMLVETQAPEPTGAGAAEGSVEAGASGTVALASPKVNVCLVFPVAHAAPSKTSPTTVKQVPFSPTEARDVELEPALKVNS